MQDCIAMVDEFEGSGSALIKSLSADAAELVRVLVRIEKLIIIHNTLVRKTNYIRNDRLTPGGVRALRNELEYPTGVIILILLK